MKLNEHQLRLWNRMLESIESYRKGELSLYDLVNGVDLWGIWDAGEFKDDKLLIEWEKFWGPLEIWNAIKQDGRMIPDAEVEQDVSNMESFLKSKSDLYNQVEEEE